MNREELKKRLAKIGIGDNRYSLNGELIADRIVLYPNYSKWEVFYFSERGTREHYQVFPSEEQACQCIFEMLEDELQRMAFDAVSQDKMDLAIARFKEVLSIDPCREQAWMALYDIYVHTDIPSAYHLLQTVYALMPTDFNVLSKMASFYLRVKNDREKAKEYSDLLLKTYPSDARAYYIVGGNLLSVDHPKAMEMLHRAIELDESYILPYITLAVQYERAKEYQKAYDLLKKGYQKGDDSKPGRGSRFELKYHMERIENRIRNL